MTDKEKKRYKKYGVILIDGKYFINSKATFTIENDYGDDYKQKIEFNDSTTFQEMPNLGGDLFINGFCIKLDPIDKKQIEQHNIKK